TQFLAIVFARAYNYANCLLEAGHAVTRLALLKQAVGIVIRPGEYYCEELGLPDAPSEREPALFQDWLVVVRAGEAAQVHFTSDGAASYLAARDDNEMRRCSS